MAEEWKQSRVVRLANANSYRFATLMADQKDFTFLIFTVKSIIKHTEIILREAVTS